MDELQGNREQPSESLEMDELQTRLRECLALISSDQAEAFCLCCLEEWSYKEAATQLGISVQAVGVLVHRARHKLRQLMDSTNAGASRRLHTAPPEKEESR